MISLDLARRLKIKLNSQKRIKVSGLGGGPSNITSSAQIKITLGWRVVYVMDVWVTNIGEGVDVLLGMDFMFSAGLRIDVNTGISQSAPFEDYICDLENMQMWPSDTENGARSKMSYGQGEVISGSPKLTPVARIAGYGNIPIVGQFVRPGLRRYMDWQQIIQEKTLSAKERVRQEAYDEMLRDAAPPAVMVPKYKWSTKLLVGPRQPERAQVTKIVEELQPQRDTDGVESAEDATLGAYSPSVIGSLINVEASPEPVTLDVNAQDGGEILNSGSCGEGLDGMAQGSECDAFQDDPSIEDEDFELPSSAAPVTPLTRLDAAYARCMRVSAEELDLEPAVYIREGSELISQLNDQLVMLPDLDDLSPECDIEAADVGEPGESTEAQEKLLKAVLKRHRKIFLGDGNAAPPPARGVICDLDVGDARPVAQRPRSVGPHLAIKVYKLLKKLLEATLIEHSESPWASPIVIVLKKNGVDIRMCIDYRVVNSFIQLSNYPTTDRRSHYRFRRDDVVYES
ncbi:hypothetical protein PHMEG_00019118 [Phytophthora megakarya]|uniref:Reverse transcriptase n=1 Tax=Phytophthora megakarya TaxID=4795 RepID=A0A225VU77_9STRA|nr:hypothetical protein PHMEG_00019118 [Phytophthora megakarya]